MCALLVVLSGTQLTRHGDRIAELTGWGKAWLGLILMASVTSLPELITGISSVTFVGEPDLAAGDAFGSCVFNLLILSLVDVWLRKPLASRVKESHVVAGMFGIILLAIASLALAVPDAFPVIGWISSASVLLAATYFIAVFVLYRYAQNHRELTAERVATPRDKTQLAYSVKIYIVNAIVVIVAAVFLPGFGEKLAEQSGLSTSFFGTLFLAATTSLPELIVSISAVRLRSFDLLVGNLLGSNMFNMLIVAIDDTAYVTGSLFKDVSPSHLVSVIVTIVMTAVVGLGVMVKFQRKVWRLGVDSFTILVLYIALILFLFHSQS